MASQRASITKELLRESLESVLKPFRIHSFDDGKFSCVLEFLMGRKAFVNRPTGSGTQLVVSNIRFFSRVHSPRARCEESVLSGYMFPISCTNSSSTLNDTSLSTPPSHALANSPINPDNLEFQLIRHPDRAKVDYLIIGFRTGFRLGFHPNTIELKPPAGRPRRTVHQHTTIPRPEVIDEYLSTEIQAGRVLGPTTVPPPSLHINRFGVIPPKNKPNSWRLILDLSFPAGHSVFLAFLKTNSRCHIPK